MSTPESKNLDKGAQARRDRFRLVLGRIKGTQEEIAAQIGVSSTYVSQMNAGSRRVTAGVARRIENHYGYQERWIMEGAGPYRLGRDGPEYMTTFSRPEAPEPEADVISRVAYHCGACQGQVVARLRSCPHCGALLRWWTVQEDD